MDWKPKATIPTFLGVLLFLLDFPGRLGVLKSLYSALPPQIQPWLFHLAALLLLGVGVVFGVVEAKNSNDAARLLDHRAVPIAPVPRKRKWLPLVVSAFCALLVAAIVISVVKISQFRDNTLRHPPAFIPAAAPAPPIARKKITHAGRAGELPSAGPGPGSTQPYLGDSCIGYDAGSLYVSAQSSGYMVKNDSVTIPITFESETQALVFSHESRSHTGLCTTPNPDDDLKRGFDVFIVWTGASSQPSGNLLTPFPTCTFLRTLTVNREFEQGPFYLENDGKAVLMFDSLSSANRALSLFSSSGMGLALGGELCEIGISAPREVGNEKRPVIAYKTP